MEKRLSFWMIILFIPIILIGTLFLTNNLFNISLKHDVKNVQTMEELIAKEVQNTLRRETKYSEIVSLSQKHSMQYSRQGLQVKFAYKGKFFDATNVQDYLKAMNIGNRSGMLYTKGDKPQYIIANPISNELIMYTFQDLSDLYAQRKQMHGIAMYFALAASGVIVAIACFLAKGVTKPIKQLTYATKALAKGDKNIKIPNYNKKDEIGELGEAFAIMQQAVADRENELKTELENKEYLLSALSHEMRTPLTCILGNTRLLQSASVNKEEQEDLLEGIVEQVKRLRDMEAQLMLVVDNNQNDFVLNDVNILNLLNNVKNDLSEQLKGINVEVLGNDNTIKANYDLLYIMATNIVTNAAFANSKNIKLISNYYGFSVEDDGIGIGDEQLKKVFNPFYKVNTARTRSHGGAGLGLSICKRIADLHNGSLNISSQIGKGTTVTYRQ
ncbi:MAG: HAMP domain-containing histidine kinase [Christensenellaceae bacterium]|nr:HAMP domain-containing histidine kinase [Christensenellaceae bacterium]